MGILDDLLGGGTRRQEFQEFVNRYNQGHPADGYADQEVLDRYRDVAHAVPVDEYARAAQEALARLSPEERAEFVRMLQERARTRGVSVPARVGTDPRDLGQVLTDLHQRPGQLRDLLGGPRGGGGGSVPAGGAPAGAPENPLGSILASPLAKAALAGIAAMVVKRYMRG